jgi:hypothetical protein
MKKEAGQESFWLGLLFLWDYAKEKDRTSFLSARKKEIVSRPSNIRYNS